LTGREGKGREGKGRDGVVCTKISSKAELFCRHAKETKHLLASDSTSLNSTVTVTRLRMPMISLSLFFRNHSINNVWQTKPARLQIFISATRMTIDPSPISRSHFDIFFCSGLFVLVFNSTLLTTIVDMI
jgi:hypothetical protein